MVLVAIFLMTLLFAIGLAVDAGQLFVARRTAQEAADAGAFAAALVLYQGGSQAQAAAAADATRNGYTHGGDGGLTTVYVYLPPNSGPYATNPNFAEVFISTQVRTALVPADRNGAGTAADARRVARIRLPPRGRAGVIRVTRSG